MALTGTETLYVLGQNPTGVPAASQFQCTTQQIADLGESGGNPTFDTVIFSGSTSGTTTVQATAIAGTTTLTLPAATDTLVGKATTDTLTNKTLTAPVLGGSVTGTYTLAGTPTIAGATLTTANITSVAAGRTGTFTANAATPVVVSNANFGANSTVIIGLKTIGGTPAEVFMSAATAGVSFAMSSLSGNTSIYNYTIIG